MSRAETEGGAVRRRFTWRPTSGPSWLRPLVDNIGQIPDAYRRRLPADVLAMVTAAKAEASVGPRRAARLQFWCCSRARSLGRSDGGVPDDADLLLTVRASTLASPRGPGGVPRRRIRSHRRRSGRHRLARGLRRDRDRRQQASSPGHIGAAFIAPSQFHVVPVLAYSPDPGPVTVVNETETAIVSRVPLRAFINPANRLMVYRGDLGNRWAGPAFLLNQMLVWGFTGQVISAVLDVAGWAKPWDTNDIRELDDVMVLVGDQGGAR